MLLAPLLVALLVAGPAPKGTKLDQAQKAFATGDYDGALKLLEPLQEATDTATQEKVQLLRAQCFAARQDFARAEEAFTLALEANPETSLDPTRVDPAVVKMLDGLRARLTGELMVTSNPPAEVSVDGKVLGTTPVNGPAGIGRHKVEAKFGGQVATAEVLVYVRRPSQVVFAQAPGGLGGGKDGPVNPMPSKLRPFAELRGVWQPNAGDGALEVGGGIEFPYTRLGVAARLFPDFFGFTLRGGVVVPVHELFTAFIELEWPFEFHSQVVAIGLGGVGGAEFHVSKWLGLFVQIGGRHYFNNSAVSNVDNRFIAGAGVRLRLP